MKSAFFKLLALVFLTSIAPETKLLAQTKINSDSIQNKMQWFADAKLGIFIHWGIYAVNGISESWSFHNKEISYPNYMQQLNGFTAAKYEPNYWADLIKESGARYAVLTTKHHDGVALWPTSASSLNMAQASPAKKDLLAPFYNALKSRGIKAGTYFSLLDWSYPDYPGFLKDSTRYKVANDPIRWKKFTNFLDHQLGEIMQNYQPDLMWFDGDWEHSAEEWDAVGIRKKLLQYNPNLIINGRLTGLSLIHI